MPSYPITTGPYGRSDPAFAASTVTTSDTTNLPATAKGLYVGGTGNVTVIMANDESQLFSSVPAGTILPISIKRINATGTTATNMVALY